MTTADLESARAEPALGPSAAPNGSAAELVELAVPRGCPFLLSEAGGWRLDVPSREHRCAAVTPAAPLAPEKQARLCLTPAHLGCATYMASLAAKEARLGVVPTDRATRWSLARTTSVIEDAGGVRARVGSVLNDRRRWPAIPAVLLVTTLFALAVSGFRAEIPSTAGATSTPATSTPAATANATPAPAPSTQPSEPSPTTAPTTVPSSVPTALPEPTARRTPKPAPTFRTYVVRPGDTLSAIAARFGTTVAAIVDLNNLPNANQLTVGQVLLIP